MIMDRIAEYSPTIRVTIFLGKTLTTSNLLFQKLLESPEKNIRYQRCSFSSEQGALILTENSSSLTFKILGLAHVQF
jgi:hypothetical protein